MKIGSKSNLMQLSSKFAPNSYDKKTYFYTKINVCKFAYVEIISYLCIIKEGEKLLNKST